jgi:hypothetical protein
MLAAITRSRIVLVAAYRSEKLRIIRPAAKSLLEPHAVAGDRPGKKAINDSVKKPNEDRSKLILVQR